MLTASRTELNRAGMRVTQQRTLIMEVIRQGQGHLGADEIYRCAREREPRISLSTVYRTLQRLKQLDLIEERHFDEEHHHYEAKPAAEHHHLVCLGCGRVVEFHYPLARHLKEQVPEAGDFDVTGAEVRLSGYCAKCQRSRK
jgi:Fe2+ or Zn2+ uptake regulation protein